MFPLSSEVVTVGLRLRRVVGGSIDPKRGGEGTLDVAAFHAGDFWQVSLSAAVTHGSVWRYSEVSGGAGLAGRLDLWSRLSVSAGLGRYTAAFGADRRGWHRSVGAGVVLSGFAVAARVTSTDLGIGSGFGITVGYKPRGLAGTGR
jgi:hypothetical protein